MKLQCFDDSDVDSTEIKKDSPNNHAANSPTRPNLVHVNETTKRTVNGTANGTANGTENRMSNGTANENLSSTEINGISSIPSEIPSRLSAKRKRENIIELTSEQRSLLTEQVTKTLTQGIQSSQACILL